MILSFDKTSSESESKQIYNQLRHRIETGQLGPGSKLPAAPQLARQLRLPRSSVERAFELLISANMIKRQQGVVVVSGLEQSADAAGLTGQDLETISSADQDALQWCAALPRRVSHIRIDRGEMSVWARFSLFSVDGEEETGVDQIGLVSDWLEEQDHQSMDPAHLLSELNTFLVRQRGIEEPEVAAASVLVRPGAESIVFSTAGKMMVTGEHAEEEFRNMCRRSPGLGELPATTYRLREAPAQEVFAFVHADMLLQECIQGRPIGVSQFQAELAAVSSLSPKVALSRLSERLEDYCDEPLSDLAWPTMIVKTAKQIQGELQK